LALKKILKLLSMYQAARHGHRYGSHYEPWKRKKWKGPKHDRYSGYGYPPYPPPHGYGSDHGSYGYGRPRGLKGVIIDVIVRKLLRYR
jgi:hypothetical protein